MKSPVVHHLSNRREVEIEIFCGKKQKADAVPLANTSLIAHFAPHVAAKYPLAKDSQPGAGLKWDVSISLAR